MHLETENSIEHFSVETRARNRFRKLLDRFATVVVTTGGLAVIIGILGLLVLFLAVIAPLWQKAEVKIIARVPVAKLFEEKPETILGLGCEEYQQVGFVMNSAGTVQFFDLPTFSRLQNFTPPLAPGTRIVSAQLHQDEKTFALGTSQGEVLFGAIDYRAAFEEARRIFNPTVSFAVTIRLDSSKQALSQLTFAGSPSENFFAAGLTADARLVFYRSETATSLFGSGEVKEDRHTLSDLPGEPTALLAEKSLQHLFVGYANGMLHKYKVDALGTPQLAEQVQATDSKITRLGFLIGERSLVVCDERGRVEVWFSAFDESEAGPPKLRKAHTLASHHSEVSSFAASQRNRTFFTGSDDGEVILHYSTNARTLYQNKLSETAFTAIAMAPKGDGALLLDAQQNLFHLTLDNPHPETSGAAFFSKIWNEGYAKPEYVWQSSGGTDDFEPKSLSENLVFV